MNTNPLVNLRGLSISGSLLDAIFSPQPLATGAQGLAEPQLTPHPVKEGGLPKVDFKITPSEFPITPLYLWVLCHSTGFPWVPAPPVTHPKPLSPTPTQPLL